MKLCKDCKYFEEAPEQEAFCLHPRAIKYDDLVYGNHSKKTCRMMRTTGEDCSSIGKLWISKPGFVPT